MLGDDLSIIIPLYRRTDRIEFVYESARAATPDAEILFVVSYDDDPVRAVLDELALTHLVTEWRGGERGDYARKINLGYRSTVTPVIFTGADDLDFHADWYARARPLLDVPHDAITVLAGGLLEGPDKIPTIGVVGTIDLCNGRTMDGTHSTHTLVARWYADQGGTIDADHLIYHQEYWHEYCDDELVQTAMARGAYAHSSGVVEHLHHLVGKAAMDDTYRHGQARTDWSRRLFSQRRRLWTVPRSSMLGQYPRRAVAR